ncbi:MAG TPA: ABC transporter ATP-binding protein [Stackebrandtia sp.]|jgi:phospholipid/cholesterol/gamma-HCH transport system ATP-binding protein|uniref:ABC transporter ATP-binding protein n=1 Tax=Stackebrandtia sp. TaxID=2023065 RepID=UPI002D554396|nr:ABC transporter ATP-binding protein [Stackebrandtia sp.]HZE38584.1 ABC transporter ATP-binding protein [Stackebrandtia sp.]
MGVGAEVVGLTKSFNGGRPVWSDVTFTIPAGDITVLLGPSGTGKSVFLKTLIGLLRPDTGKVYIDNQDITSMGDRDLYAMRQRCGVLFQDGALFGSMNLYDNIAFPLREHTRKPEREIRRIVMELMDLVGLSGDDDKLPAEISGGMRKRAGLARALVMNPELILCDEPDSGLDPVRTAHLSKLIAELNAETGATFLIVTHDINTARTLPDHIGMLYLRELIAFGSRDDILASEEPVVKQFLNAALDGPIGMSEERDAVDPIPHEFGAAQ